MIEAKLSGRRLAQILTIVLTMLVFLTAGLLISKTRASQTRAQDSRSGQWIIDTTRGTNQYQLTLNYSSVRRGFGNNITSFSLSPDRLQGLTGAQIMSAGSQVQFQLIRDAGTFNCEGWFKAGKGSGHFVFSASPGFAAELQKRGYQPPSDAQQYSLALSDVGIAFLDELNAQGYDRPSSMDQLVRMGEHGVSLEYVRDLKAQGYSVQSIELLTKMVDHGVTSSFIRELDGLGFKQLPVETLIRTVDHGVNARFINELAAAGYTGLSLEQLTRTIDHGVNANFIKEVETLGYGRPPLEQLVRMQDHGVNGKFINGLREMGFQNLSIEQLVRMQDHGVTPAFIKKMRARGFTETSIDELIRLADHGFNN